MAVAAGLHDVCIHVGHELVVYNKFRGTDVATEPTDVHTLKYGALFVRTIIGAFPTYIWIPHLATEQHLVACQSRMFTFLQRNC